jgi:hypothetical protein
VNPLSSVGSVSLTTGAGVVIASHIGSDPREYIVKLGGVADAQHLSLTLNDVTDSFRYSSSSIGLIFGILLGDTNGNGSVTASDIAQTKTQAGQPVTGANFRTDLNANGAISASDIGL